MLFCWCFFGLPLLWMVTWRFSAFFTPLTRYCYLKVTKFSSRALGNVNMPKNSVDGNEHIPWPSGEEKIFEKLLAQFPPLLTFCFARKFSERIVSWTCSFSQYFLCTTRKLSARTNFGIFRVHNFSSNVQKILKRNDLRKKNRSRTRGFWAVVYRLANFYSKMAWWAGCGCVLSTDGISLNHMLQFRDNPWKSRLHERQAPLSEV
jgi:hypothetical protein